MMGALVRHTWLLVFAVSISLSPDWRIGAKMRGSRGILRAFEKTRGASQESNSNQFTTSRHSGWCCACALKKGQSGIIFQPPVRAASTACSANAWPTPLPRRAAGTAV
ncbi:hypothetical protein RHECNPAF_3500054 [Rhizobium etli CNPAF512]|nr:hypothetical protein RHECNPAF_3500054 [Rhizobium etli CNPAF512]